MLGVSGAAAVVFFACLEGNRKVNWGDYILVMIYVSSLFYVAGLSWTNSFFVIPTLKLSKQHFFD